MYVNIDRPGSNKQESEISNEQADRGRNGKGE